jgi:hypothetical protein
MIKVSLRKKIQLYLTYRKTLENNRENLFQNFTSRIDKVYRIYTVINLPKEELDEPYNFRKRDLDIFAEKYIRDYSQNIAKYLNSLGLNELYDIYEVKKVDKFSYLIVIGYKLFNTDKLARTFWLKVLPWTAGIVTLGLVILKLLL